MTNNNLRNRLLLLHQLNVGYECTACKIGFASRRELMNHLEKVHLNPKKGDYKCTICGKMFGNNQIFRLHSQIHGLREVGAIQEKIREQKSNLSEIEKKITAITTSPAENKKAKKKIGLTKVRMEDCLRCDPCSCIYLDKNDYFKHMRNFHKITDLDTLKSSNTPAHFMLVDKPNNSTTGRKSSSSKSREQATNTECSTKDCEKLFQATMKDIIKERWTQMISRSKLEAERHKIKIKPDPDAGCPYNVCSYPCNNVSNLPCNNVSNLPCNNVSSHPCNNVSSLPPEHYDMSHLLSQVEVKIETE